MRYLLLLLILCGGYATVTAQLTNGGATIVIEAGAQLTLEKPVLNQNSGSITNNGTLTVEGDLENTGQLNTGFSTSRIVFSGGSPSIFTPGGASISNLENRKAGADLSLAGDLFVSGTVDLTEATNSRIVLGDDDLTLDQLAEIVGADDDAYVRTNGAGYLIKEMSGGVTSFTFPVGNTGVSTPLSASVSGSFSSNAQLKVKVNPTAAADLPDGTADFISRHWEVIAENISDYQNDVEGTYLSMDVNGIESTIVGTSYANGEWSDLNADRTNTTLSGTITATDALFTGFNTAILPLELTYFEVEKRKKDEALLAWTTASEIGTSHFEIERSIDALNWETLGGVAAAGESNRALAYAYTDSAIPPGVRQAGTVYYRLLMHDLDGAKAYSPVRVLHFDGDDNSLLIYPNPTAGMVMIGAGEEIRAVAVFDNLGKLLLSAAASELDLSHLPEGVYHLVVHTDSETRSRTVVKTSSR